MNGISSFWFCANRVSITAADPDFDRAAASLSGLAEPPPACASVARRFEYVPLSAYMAHSSICPGLCPMSRNELIDAIFVSRSMCPRST